MPNKYFNVNKPKQIITITEDEGNFYKLSDGNMIKKDTFMQKYQPVLDDIIESAPPTLKTGNETLDPDSFFNAKSIPDDVISGVKQADPNKGVGEGEVNRTEVKNTGMSQTSNPKSQMNESLVRQVPETTIPDVPNNTNTDVSQYKVYDDDEEAFADFEKKNQVGQQKPPQPQPDDIDRQKAEIEDLFLDEKMALGEEEAIARRNKRLLKIPTTKQQPQQVEVDGPNAEYYEPTQKQPAEQLSPIELMFSTFKRKHNITINVSFEDKIGDPDFVKLMVENMDGDIVGYYKRMVMENIMKDLSKIEEAVEREIQMEIFGEVIEKEVVEEKTEPVLIKGGTTKTGKQKFKYVDSQGNIKELLPNTAKTKGYEPYTEA